MIRILHLSDLHFCNDVQSNNMKNNILKAVRDARIQELREGEKLLIITGDFHNFSAENFSVAETFINQLVKEMDIKREKDIFIVPGNHDVGNDTAMDAALGTTNPIWSDMNIGAVASIRGGNLVKLLDYRLRMFIPYCQFACSIGVYSKEEANVLLPAKVHVRRWREKLNILHLNTALVADGSAKDNQMVDMNAVVSDDVRAELMKDGLPILVLGHNNFYDLNEEQQGQLKTAFGNLDHENISAYLCGDTHRRNLDDWHRRILLHPINTNSPGIANIVCVKGISEQHDNYSDFGFYLHEWDEETDCVTARLKSWVPDTLSDFYDNGTGNIIYRMHRQNALSTPSNIEQTQQECEVIQYSELKARYYQYILQQSSEIETKGMPLNQEDIGRFYNLKQIFIPEHFIQINSKNKTDDPDAFLDFVVPWNNSDNIVELLPSDKPFKNLVLADPGSGKTTLIKWIVSTCCTQETYNEEERHIQSLNLFPIWIRCRDIKEEQPTVWDSILDIARLAEWYPSRSVEQFKDLIEKHLTDGNTLLLIDGVDEIDDRKKRSQFIRQIGIFMRHYPKVNAVVTSRSKGYSIASEDAFSDFSKWGIQPLSSDDISLLCEKWYFLVYGANEKSKEKAHSLAKQINSNVSLKKLASNPLMLTTLLIIERRVGNLPNKRAGLYRHAIDVLLESWNKDVHETLDLNDAKYQLAFVAFHMMTDKQRRRSNRTQIAKPELQKILRRVRSSFSNFVYTREPIDKFLEKIEQKSAILYKLGIANTEDGHEEPLYSFQHLSFEEYLAAYAIAEGCYPGANKENRDGKILFDNLLNPEMREVIALTGAISPHCAANISKRIIHLLNIENNNEDINSLRSLLLQLIADEVSISPDIVKEAFNVLFHSCIDGKDRSFLALILTGKFGNILIEYFKQVDDIYHHGVMGWSSIPIILTDDAFNPINYYLQHREAEKPVQIANALCFLANGYWIRGKKWFNDATSDKLEIIRKDIVKGLTNKEISILYGILEVVYMCVPGIWKTLSNISEYYSALVYYINQTCRVPDFLAFNEYDRECFCGSSIAPVEKSTSESIQTLLKYINESSSWDQDAFRKALTIVLFASISCGNEQEQYIIQIYSSVMKMFREEQDRLRSCMIEFISFVENIINSRTFIALPEKIGVAFNHFYEEAVEIIDALNLSHDIINEHNINEKPSAFDLDELIKRIDQRIAELERKEQ